MIVWVAGAVLANLMFDWMFRGGGDFGRGAAIAVVILWIGARQGRLLARADHGGAIGGRSQETESQEEEGRSACIGDW